MKQFCQDLLKYGDKAVILDTETTGLGDGAEILQIGVLSLAGDVLLDTLVRPSHVQSWPEAQAVHGITPEMVKSANTIDKLHLILESALKDKEIVVYNADYDRRLVWQSIEAADASRRFNWLYYCPWIDVMEPYAEFYGQWHDYFQSYTWQSLTNACHQQNIIVEDAHAAIGDCRMTLALIQKIAAL